MHHRIIFATDLSPASDQVLSSLGGLRAVGTQEVVLTYALGIDPFWSFPLPADDAKEE